MINIKLKKYIDENILIQYHSYDKAHNLDHINDVIQQSLIIAKNYDVNYDIVYTVAAFHDLGLIHGRETHHITSAQMMKEDKFIIEFFSDLEIDIMAQAIIDHRASSKNPPLSIYGCIVSSADKTIDIDKIINRCTDFGKSISPELNFIDSYQRTYEHLIDKYSETGYMKLPIVSDRNMLQLTNLRNLIKDQKALKQKCFLSYFKGVIFDFNGTLVFDEPYHLKAWNETLSSLNLPIMSDEDHKNLTGKTNKMILKNYIELNDEEYDYYSKLKEELYRKQIVENNVLLVDGAYELFDLLKMNNIKFTIASASIKENIDFFYEYFNLNKYMTYSNIIYDNHTYKNKVLMFIDAANNLKTDINETLIFEDSITGINCSFEAGFNNVIAITNKKKESFKKPLIATIKDFI